MAILYSAVYFSLTSPVYILKLSIIYSFTDVYIFLNLYCIIIIDISSTNVFINSPTAKEIIKCRYMFIKKIFD